MEAIDLILHALYNVRMVRKFVGDELMSSQFHPIPIRSDEWEK